VRERVAPELLAQLLDRRPQPLERDPVVAKLAQQTSLDELTLGDCVVASRPLAEHGWVLRPGAHVPVQPPASRAQIDPLHHEHRMMIGRRA